jgi:creatinine amidohydrolase
MRSFYGDGNYEGYYQRSDEEMLALWDVAVAETRALMSTGWDTP